MSAAPTVAARLQRLRLDAAARATVRLHYHMAICGPIWPHRGLDVLLLRLRPCRSIPAWPGSDGENK